MKLKHKRMLVNKKSISLISFNQIDYKIMTHLHTKNMLPKVCTH